MQKTENLDTFVRGFVDEQIGLDCATYEVYTNASGFDSISITSIGAMSRLEWKEMGNELIKSLDAAGFSQFEIDSVGVKHIRLMQVGFYQYG